MMNKKNKLTTCINNNTGSTVFMVLAVSAIIAIGIGFLADRIQTQKKLSTDLNSNVSYSIAIQSVTDFARHALKQKWCFDGTAGNFDFNPGDGANCAGNYTHTHSTLRLTLPLKFAQKLTQYKESYPTLVSGTFPAISGTTPHTPAQLNQQAQDMLLQSFEIQGPTISIPDQHPLKQIIDNAKGKDPIKYIRIRYEVISDINLPNTGDEVYVKITTALLNGSGNVIQNGSFKASETDLIYVAPRELNFFSLVLRGSMILNQSANDEDSTGLGNAFIPQATGNGLSFYSPIYIQKNLVLPATGAQKSPVTFYEPITFGSGYVAQASSLGSPGFQSNGALGANREWSDTNLFGGLLKGFETDSSNDSGFDALAGTNTNAAANNALTLHCIDRIRESTSPTLTLGSQLYANMTSATPAVSSPTVTNVIRSYRVAFLKNTINGIQKRFNRQVNPNDPIVKPSNIGNASGNPNMIAAFIPTAIANDPRTVSIMVNVGSFNGVSLNDIPVPDGMSAANPGETIVRIKKHPNDNDPAELKIRVNDVYINGVSQPHLRDVTVELVDSSKLTHPTYGNRPIEYIKIIGMDNTCTAGVCAGAPMGSGDYKAFYLKKFTDFSNDSGGATSLCDPTKIYKQYSYMLTPNCQSTPNITMHSIPTGYIFPSGTEDIGTRDQQCQSAGNTSLANYNASQTEQYFSEHSSDGWEFTPDRAPSINPSTGTKIYPDLTFSNFNSTSVNTSSMNGKCIVPSSVVRVVGNYVCQKLIIRSRTQRLQMIGTFIVIDKLYIHANAMTAGIDFYSIHSPQAVSILKDAQVLKTGSGQSCESLPKPHWHPDPGLQTLADRLNCSPLATLRHGTPEKYPMRWTAVTADCVTYPANQTETRCLKKIRNYLYKSIERQYVR